MTTGDHLGLVVGFRIEDKAAALAQPETGRKLVAKVATDRT